MTVSFFATSFWLGASRPRSASVSSVEQPVERLAVFCNARLLAFFSTGVVVDILLVKSVHALFPPRAFNCWTFSMLFVKWQSSLFFTLADFPFFFAHFCRCWGPLGKYRACVIISPTCVMITWHVPWLCDIALSRRASHPIIQHIARSYDMAYDSDMRNDYICFFQDQTKCLAIIAFTMFLCGMSHNCGTSPRKYLKIISHEFWSRGMRLVRRIPFFFGGRIFWS